MPRPPVRKDPRDELINEHRPDLAELEKPLRRLLVLVRYWDGEKAADIHQELVRNIANRSDRTVVFNGLTQVDRHVKFGDDHEYILGNLYYYLFLHFRQRFRARNNTIDPLVYPLLHQCFGDRLPIPKGFDRLLTRDDLRQAAVRKFCGSHQGLYFGYRFGTSRDLRYNDGRTVAKFLIKVFPWEFGFAKYNLVYRGKNNPKFSGPYDRTISGPICVIGDRAHFVGQEDSRDHLSYMVWPHSGGQTGPQPNEFRKGIMTASDPDEKLFSAQFVYTRISEDCTTKADEFDIGVFTLPELMASDDAVRRIIDQKWLENTARELDVLELDPIDSEI
jgi:hypothetical protein